MSRFVVAPALPAQTAAALALAAEGLPALAQCGDARVRFFVATAGSDPGQLLGAAALLPAAQRGGAWGFRAHVQVLPAHRRQGIARALVTAVQQEAARWGVPRLISWDTLADGPASAFLPALGAQVAYTLHHFVPHKDTALPRCERLVAALHRHGHVPPGFAVVPLHAVPREPVLALHCSEFNADPGASARLFDESLADPPLARLSLALWDGHELAGYLLAGQGGGLPLVDFWATPPGQRTGWAAALLLHGFVARVVAGGGAQARFHCNERATAPMNFARRTGAALERITHGWTLDVPAPATAPVAAPSAPAGPGERSVLLALAGPSLAQLHRLCEPGGLPHLAQLLAAGQIGASPEAPWWDAWQDAWQDAGHRGPGTRVIGWPDAPAAAAELPAGSTWVGATFDDPALRAPEFWALDPASVRPLADAPLVRAARMAPAEVQAEPLAAVLAPLPAHLRAALSRPGAGLLARWVSRHNLGVHWAASPEGGRLAVRFDGLPECLAQAGLQAQDAEHALVAWLGFFDLLLGRYRQLAGASGSVRLLLETAIGPGPLSPTPPTPAGPWAARS